MDGNNFNQYEENNTDQGYQEFYDNDSYDAPPSGVNVQGLVGMILGIVGCVSTICCCGASINSVPTLGMGIAALILGNIGKKREDRPKTMANVAFILGIVVIALSVISFILSLLGQSLNLVTSITPDITNTINQMMQGN